MSKKEFLDELRRSLEGEVSSSVIDQNIRYYDQYISSADNEKRVIEELGSPRLIAKTIIESERAARQKGYYKGKEDFQSNYHNTDQQYTWSKSEAGSDKEEMHSLTWSQKLGIIIAIVVAFLILVIVGRVVLAFLFAFGIPIILVLLLISLIKKHR